ECRRPRNSGRLRRGEIDAAALPRGRAGKAVRDAAATLAKILPFEHESEHVAVILTALAELPPQDAVSVYETVLRDQKQTSGNRLVATKAYLKGLGNEDAKRLLATAESVEDGPILAELLRAIAARKVQSGAALLLRKATSANAEVRVRAVEALAEVGAADARSTVDKLLDDPDTRVRAAAAIAAGKLTLRSATNRL